jgi:CMP-N-acetylneuraminic acid synthetase
LHPEIASPPRLISVRQHYAQDDTPMIEVVQHAEPDPRDRGLDIIVLLQPTQPFRTPEHVQQAIRLLQETQADSVVSVVPLPLSHSPMLYNSIETTKYGWS